MAERQQKSIDLISKQKKVARAAHFCTFLYISLRCFARLQCRFVPAAHSFVHFFAFALHDYNAVYYR